MIPEINAVHRNHHALASTLQVQRTAQKLQQVQLQALLPPIQRHSGADSASFSSEALARLAAEESYEPETTVDDSASNQVPSSEPPPSET
jgi:hypothetical protein